MTQGPRQVLVLYYAITFGRAHEALPSAVPNKVSKESQGVYSLTSLLSGKLLNGKILLLPRLFNYI